LGRHRFDPLFRHHLYFSWTYLKRVIAEVSTNVRLSDVFRENTFHVPAPMENGYTCNGFVSGR
jgi:hypothetical protein